MDFTISHYELSALCGLPHLQQIIYLRGVRPYMDYKTGIVGLKRGISYQSIKEELYVEPHQGIKSGSPSKDQIRRSLKGLERSGNILIQSTAEKLILKCLLATVNNSKQNKAATMSPPLTASPNNSVSLDPIRVNGDLSIKATIAKTSKAAIPHKENNLYIFLKQQFEKFWLAYPEQKSKHTAWLEFEIINPNEKLVEQMINALKQQTQLRQQKQNQGQWLPPWKYPANWLSQQCWNDVSDLKPHKEKKHASHKKISASGSKTADPFWDSCQEVAVSDENIIFLSEHRST